MQSKPTYKTIDEYIALFPADKQKLLTQVRASIRAAAPNAAEGIGYQMPGFYQEGALIYFAALKNHIGFYPTGEGVEAFQKDLAKYETTKGAVKFPLDQPLPLTLIKRIVKHRVAENLKKARLKKAPKK